MRGFSSAGGILVEAAHRAPNTMDHQGIILWLRKQLEIFGISGRHYNGKTMPDDIIVWRIKTILTGDDWRIIENEDVDILAVKRQVYLGVTFNKGRLINPSAVARMMRVDPDISLFMTVSGTLTEQVMAERIEDLGSTWYMSLVPGSSMQFAEGITMVQREPREGVLGVMASMENSLDVVRWAMREEPGNLDYVLMECWMKSWLAKLRGVLD